MSHRICLVTGTTSGIGRVTAEAMTRQDFEVIMVCRDTDRADAVRREITARTGNPRISVVRCDLGSLDSVHACADTVRQRIERLDVMINNAGMMTTRFQTSPEGLELTFAANYLGPWLLTRLLLDRLLAAQGRIVNVASDVHRRGTLNLAVLGEETATGFGGMAAYARSKLGNVMATLSLAERLRGTRTTANCLHPGVVATNIVGDTNALLRVGMKLLAPLFRSPARGARTTLHLALSPDIEHVSGAYYDEHQRQVEPSPTALNREARESLWHWSSRFCGLDDDQIPVIAG